MSVEPLDLRARPANLVGNVVLLCSQRSWPWSTDPRFIQPGLGLSSLSSCRHSYGSNVSLTALSVKRFVASYKVLNKCSCIAITHLHYFYRQFNVFSLLSLLALGKSIHSFLLHRVLFSFILRTWVSRIWSWMLIRYGCHSMILCGVALGLLIRLMTLHRERWRLLSSILEFLLWNPSGHRMNLIIRGLGFDHYFQVRGKLRSSRCVDLRSTLECVSWCLRRIDLHNKILSTEPSFRIFLIAF